jgi:hypothetical protein
MDGQLVAGEVQDRSADRKRGIVVTDGDINILKLIYDYRLLRIPHIEALTGRTYTRVHRRLKGLYDAGYLKRRSAPQTKDIYHMGRKGLALLLSDGRITEEEALRRGREHELRPQTLEHEMMIADIHVMLELATREGPSDLMSWREGEDTRDSFDVSEHGVPRRVVIAPDAFFQLKDTRLNAVRSFFLEADRSTMVNIPRPGSQRFRDKIDRYRWFIQADRPLQRYGASAVRVLTVTLTPARRDNLCSDADTFLLEHDAPRLRKSFLYGSLKDVSIERPESILAPIFRRPGSDKPFPLFPTLAETAERA